MSRRAHARKPAPKLTVEQALAEVSDDLPDGAWMQALCDLTGLDAGDVSSQLARLTDHGRKEVVVADGGVSFEDATTKREVLKGQVWKRKDPSGAWVEFEVINITLGPTHGQMVHGKTKRGKVIKCGLGNMLRDRERFVLVHDRYVRRGS